TLLSLRLVSRSINSLISSYESSIAKSVAQNLCPWCDEHTLAAHTPSTLTDLIYFVHLNAVHDLATKAVACTRLSRSRRQVLHHGIRPADDLGNQIHYKVQQCFIIISRLSRICQDVTDNPPEASTNRRRNPLSRRLSSTSKAVEETILRRCLEYMATCRRDDVIDLHVALWCLQANTATNHLNLVLGCLKAKTDRGSVPIQWMAYHLVRKGLRSTDHLWSDDLRIAQSARYMMQLDMEHRSAKLIKLEHSTFHTLLTHCR
ncbi:MAG: hypothetical protein Q9173_006858, partial [Seirophora scorigena]